MSLTKTLGLHVEVSGFEPLTTAVQKRCSTN